MIFEEVNKPLRVSMNERMGWFPVIVTRINAPPLTQEIPFAFAVTLFLENLLDFVFSPLDDPMR